MQNPEITPEWMGEETTYLLKTVTKKTLKPIDRSLVFQEPKKLLTLVVTNGSYLHLEQNDLFPLEHNGCRLGSYGCKG